MGDEVLESACWHQYKDQREMHCKIGEGNLAGRGPEVSVADKEGDGINILHVLFITLCFTILSCTSSCAKH